MILTQKLANQIDRFVKYGFKWGHFTKDIYEWLYIYTNKFIAHYDRQGFYSARFIGDGLDLTLQILLRERLNSYEIRPETYISAHFRHCYHKYNNKAKVS